MAGAVLREDALALPLLARKAGGVVTAQHVWQVAGWAPLRRWLTVVGSG
jgi:hypothetical protein